MKKNRALHQENISFITSFGNRTQDVIMQKATTLLLTTTKWPKANNIPSFQSLE